LAGFKSDGHALRWANCTAPAGSRLIPLLGDRLGRSRQLLGQTGPVDELHRKERPAFRRSPHRTPARVRGRSRRRPSPPGGIGQLPRLAYRPASSILTRLTVQRAVPCPVNHAHAARRGLPPRRDHRAWAVTVPHASWSAERDSSGSGWKIRRARVRRRGSDPIGGAPPTATRVVQHTSSGARSDHQEVSSSCGFVVLRHHTLGRRSKAIRSAISFPRLSRRWTVFVETPAARDLRVVILDSHQG